MKANRMAQEMLCKMQYIVAKPVLQTLYESEIRYAVIKGCPLSYYKTGIPGQRLSSDIDILVSRRDVNHVTEILVNNGFVSSYDMNREEKVMLVSHSHQVPSFYKNIGTLCVRIDVNFDLFWGEYTGKRIDVLEFLNDTVTLDIFGCKVRTLSPLKTLLQLVLHHYKEMNSLFVLTNGIAIHIRLFEDVYMLCKRYPELLSANNLYIESRRYGILPYVYYMFFFTQKVYADCLLDAYIEKLFTEEGEALLNCYGLTEEERRSWDIEFEERMDKNISHIVLEQLTDKEKAKVEQNKKIFG